MVLWVWVTKKNVLLKIFMIVMGNVIHMTLRTRAHTHTHRTSTPKLFNNRRTLIQPSLPVTLPIAT